MRFAILSLVVLATMFGSMAVLPDWQDVRWRYCTAAGLIVGVAIILRSMCSAPMPQILREGGTVFGTLCFIAAIAVLLLIPIDAKLSVVAVSAAIMGTGFWCLR